MVLKDRLRRGEVVRGVLTVIPSPVVTQALAAAGADFVIVDREHGPIGREAVQAMVAATAGTGCAPLVRVPAIDEAEVKAALDAGAEGIVFPLVRSAADAERCVALMTYPPGGVRGWGPFAAAARHGAALGAYLAEVAPRLVCILLLETAEALEDLDAILAVPGVDAVVLAQFDLSTALGVHGRFDDPVFVEAATRIEETALARGLPLGAAALTPERAAELTGRGFRLLITGFDAVLLAEHARAARVWGA